MCNLKFFGFVILLIVLLGVYGNIEEKKYKNFIEGQGLFTNDDSVEVLINSNWETELYGKKNAWSVMFYNSSSFKSINFAPSWRNIAKDWISWKDLITFGAIDCFDEDNKEICRRFNITKYPSIRYFHENYDRKISNCGDDLENLNFEKKSLLTHIIYEQKHKRGKIFPSLIPYNHTDLNHLFKHMHNKKFVFLIFESDNSTYGAELALQLHHIPEISIRYSWKNNTKLANYLQIHNPPAVVVIRRENTLTYLGINFTIQEAYSKIEEFLKFNGIEIVPIKPNLFKIYDGYWFDEKPPEDKSPETSGMDIENAIYQMDLETALRYSLKSEVGKLKSIKGKKLEALEEYINVLAKYFPLGRRGQQFLFELRDLVALESSLDGINVSEAITEVESGPEQIFSAPQKWIACKTGNRIRHGYPCGLWKMFHFIVVQAAEKNRRSKLPKQTEVLKALFGYLEHFFQCQDCVQYFKYFADKTAMQNVASLDSAVLWLWMIHNDINKHQTNKEKYQFPSAKLCPNCRYANSSWNFAEVLENLKKVYSLKNIKYDGCDMKILSKKLDIDIILSIVIFTTSFLATFVLFMLITCTVIQGKSVCGTNKSNTKKSWRYHKTKTDDGEEHENITEETEDNK